jgi:hypothetical protein
MAAGIKAIAVTHGFGVGQTPVTAHAVSAAVSHRVLNFGGDFANSAERSQNQSRFQMLRTRFISRTRIDKMHNDFKDRRLHASVLGPNRLTRGAELARGNMD